MRRYLIDRHELVTWFLVYDRRSGKWHVERKAPREERVRFSIEEFEKSDSGRLCAASLAAALKAVEQDA